MSNFISVENLYYALEASDPVGGTSNYGTPKPVGKSVKIAVDPTIATGDFYADSALQEYATQFVSAKVSLETEVLPLSVVADILGHKLDDAGGIVYNKNDHAPYIALMYRRKKVNGSYRYIKLYKCKFADGKEDGETVTNSLKIQDDTLEGIAFCRYSDGNWKTIKDQDEPGYTDVSATWFQSVNGAAIPLTVTSSTPADGATGVSVSSPLSLIFSTNLNSSTINADNIVLMKATDGTAVETTVAYSDATKTVTVTPSGNLSAATEYILTVNKNVKDTANNILANTFIINFTTA